MSRSTLGAALTAALIVVALAGCGDRGSTATTTADATTTARYQPVAIPNCGETVKLDAPPQRAVALNQSASEILLSLGLQDRMAGTASWSDPVLPSLAAANANVPVLAKEFPSLERLLDVKPDFAYATFAYAFSGEGVAERSRFAELGIPTYLSLSECGGQEAEQKRALTVDDLYKEIGDISAIFGVQDRGAKLVADLKARAARAADQAKPGTTLLWWYSSTKAPYVAGCCGAPGLMTRAVGAENPFESSRQLWPAVSWETILKRDPTVLVLADLTRGDDGDSLKAKVDFLEHDPVAKQLTAVREHRYVVLTGSDMDPGVRNVYAIEKLADGLRELGLTR